jgi:uncharacterized protein YbjQ (UPF0145 family)
MWLSFKKETAEEKARRSLVEADIQALESGQILPRAKHRIEHHIASGGRFFSTDMTAKEHLLIEECGVQPLGQVIGSAFVRIGKYLLNNRATGEIDLISDAHRMAREKAVSRMTQEAKLYGADGIVSVRLKSERVSYFSDTIEFTAIGTSVKVHGWEPQDLYDAPFTSELSAQEFWQLIHAGYRPVSLVFGISAYYIHSNMETNFLTQSGWTMTQNQEVKEWSQGIYAARDRAISWLQKDIEKVNADGCIGMTVICDQERNDYTVGNRECTDLLVTFTAIGSSIRKLTRPHKLIERKPLTVLNLSTKRFSSIVSRTDEPSGSFVDDDFEYYE